jgi:hypothetical protein
MRIGKTGAAAVLISQVDHRRSEQFGKLLKGSQGTAVKIGEWRKVVI